MPEVRVLREIDPSARIAPDARVGPYCVVGPQVTIGPGTVLSRRVSVTGRTTIGSGNFIDEGCVLGAIPQDLKYHGEQAMLVIDHGNRFGRGVTVHIGTETGGFVTHVGSRNVLLDGCHVAHDCFVEDHTRIGRCVMLAGHILVQSGAVMGDMSGAHHFATIGRYSRVGARTPVRRDVPPYTDFYSDAYDWSPPAVRGIHDRGIAAAGLSRVEEADLRRALHELFDEESALATKIEQLVNMGAEGEVARLCDFCQQSLAGVYGRYRERFRGQVPPEAWPYLPPEKRQTLGGR